MSAKNVNKLIATSRWILLLYSRIYARSELSCSSLLCHNENDFHTERRTLVDWVPRTPNCAITSRLKQHRGKTSTHAPAWAFPVCFSVTLSSQIKVSRALLASFCVQLVVQLFWPVLLYAARVFDYFVVIEIAFMDNQAQITETITRLDSEKVRW